MSEPTETYYDMPTSFALYKLNNQLSRLAEVAEVNYSMREREYYGGWPEDLAFLSRFCDPNALEQLMKENFYLVESMRQLILAVLQYNPIIEVSVDDHGERFYTITFVDISCEARKELERNPVLTAALHRGLIYSVVCYEKGWKKNPFNIYIYESPLGREDVNDAGKNWR